MSFLQRKGRTSSDRPSTPSSTTVGKLKVVKFKESVENHAIRLKTLTIDSSSTKYSALTYTRMLPSGQASNNSINSSTIMCDNSPLQIDKTLYDALEHLREVGSDLPVWVDELCVDQRNPIDRANQTNCLGDIFSKAAHIVVWLGRTPPYANDTVYNMRKLVNAIDWRKLTPDTRFDFRDPRIYQHLGIEQISMQQWSNIFNLCNSSWFSQVWTFYELVSAKNAMFLYGDSRMDLQFMTDFSKVLELTGWADSQPQQSGDWSQPQYIGLTRMFSLVTDYRSIPIWHPKHAEHVQWMHHEYHLDSESQRAWKFFEFLVQTTEEFECTDLRDKLFAPLTLVRRGFRGRPVDQEWPLVDYVAPVEGLYANFARLILKNTGVPSILAASLPQRPVQPQVQQTSTGRQVPRRKPIDSM